MKRTALKRKTGLKRGASLKRGDRLRRTRPKPMTLAERAARNRFWEAARDQRVCAVTGTASGDWDAHHALEKQEIRRRGGDIWDPRNALRLSDRAHSQHTLAVRRVRLSELRDENIEFAVELMGLAAHVYLSRMYDGHDERLELAIAELGAPDACG